MKKISEESAQFITKILTLANGQPIVNMSNGTLKFNFCKDGEYEPCDFETPEGSGYGFFLTEYYFTALRWEKLFTMHFIVIVKEGQKYPMGFYPSYMGVHGGIGEWCLEIEDLVRLTANEQLQSIYCKFADSWLHQIARMGFLNGEVEVRSY
ncbi:MAG: hypothetical protein P4L51_28625 [Puia sp.]|nr:hypothetical protein [Puia sp.]